MDIFDVLTLIGGLCLFLFGMNLMSDGVFFAVYNLMRAKGLLLCG